MASNYAVSELHAPRPWNWKEIVSKRALSPYKTAHPSSGSRPRALVESELILLGTDYDNEGKPIAYLGRETAGKLQFAGTAFLTVSGEVRVKLQDRIGRLSSIKPPANVPKVRRPDWVKPEILVRVRHLQSGDTLRHAIVKGLVK